MERIFASALADILGQSPKTARRMLAQLEARHGHAVVGRAGRELYTTWDALERVTPFRRARATFTLKQAASVGRYAALVASLERRVAELEEVVENLRGAVLSGSSACRAVAH
jgi:hypothetical protein